MKLDNSTSSFMVLSLTKMIFLRKIFQLIKIYKKAHKYLERQSLSHILDMFQNYQSPLQNPPMHPMAEAKLIQKCMQWCLNRLIIFAIYDVLFNV